MHVAALAQTLTTVVHDQDVLTVDLASGRRVARRWAELAVLMSACAAVYGAVLGAWHGPTLAWYVAVKLPLVLLLTSSFTMCFNWIACVSFGLRLRFAQVGALTFLGLATASVLLASLSPVAALFTFCAPAPTTAARTAHNLLYLMHTGIIAACGLRGHAALWSALRATRAPMRTLRLVYATWLIAYALVGGEVAWALRPFVGSVSDKFPIVFLRPDALDGNVYEFIVTDILPHLLGFN
jgi:hypothetical protein